MMLWLALACVGSPSLRIVAPESGDRVAAGVPVAIEVGLTPADALAEVQLRFLADGTPLSGELESDTARGEATFTTAELPVGDFTLRVEATDAEGNRVDAALDLTGFANTAPTVQWVQPVDGGAVLAGVPFEVRARVEDVDDLDGIEEIALSWSGVAAGVGAAPGSIVGPGEVHFRLDGLALGAWTVGLQAEDRWGGVVASTIAFTASSGDADGDGAADAALGGDDCDDQDPSVNPAATERCNGVDDDCDGDIDGGAVDAVIWYTDDDHDGYGTTATTACEAPAGTAALGEDCDDTDPAVNPGAPEQCETGVDEDCDGTIDTDAEGSFAQWSDADGDGYGRGPAIADCVLHEGYATRNADCDDTRADVNPGATEVCDASDRDEDCDGAADDDDASATGQTRHYGDADGDGHGDPASPGSRCDAGGGWSADDDDCDDAEALAWTGAAEVCEDGADNDCAGGDAWCALAGSAGLAGADVKLTGAGANGFFGDAARSAGDRDGDGTPDLVGGAWGQGTGGTVYLIDGASLASGSVASATAVTAEAAGDELGVAVAACGDVGTDGRDDVVFSAPGNGSGAGAVYLWSGSRGSAAASTADDEVDGSAGDALGAALDCGHDVNDDGKVDVLAGATGAGAAYVYTASTLTRVGKLSGGSGAGSAVTLLDDVDGDGVDDLAVGDELANKAWLVLGSSGLGNLTLSSGADAAYTGKASGDTAGAALAGLGDLDGDGYGDLAVGAPENDDGGAAAGAAYVILGRASPASTSLSAADAAWIGIDASDRAGAAVAGPGDADADGYADLLVGAYYDETAGTGAGAAYLLYGGATFAGGSLSAADATLLGEDTRDSAGEVVAGAGDLNGDGAADLLIGAPSEASAASGAGAVYVVFGGGG